jgi:AraC-like DNA-binding protein
MTNEVAQFLRIGSQHRETAWHIAMHGHSFCEIVVVVDGSERVTFDSGETVDVGPGEILVFRCGVRHEEWSLPGDPLLTFFLSFSGDPKPEIPNRLKDRQGRLRILCEWMRELQFSSTDEAKATLRSCGETFLLELTRLDREKSGGLSEIVCRRVLDRPTQQPTLTELAKLSGISKFHYCRRYREETGSTPMQDVRRLRLLAVRNLLATGNATLKEIALQNGFRDAADLSRAFRKEYGIPPGRARTEC